MPFEIIRGLFRLPIFYVVIITISTLLTLLLDLFYNLHIIVKLSIIAIIVYFIVVATIIDIRRSQLRINLETLLNLMNKSIFGLDSNHYRSNIMIFNRKKRSLKIKYGCNQMNGALDRRLEINIDQYPDLASSRVVNNERPFWTNTTYIKGHGELVKNNKVWQDMKSVISVPIFDKNEILIGTLNVDSDLPLIHSKLSDGKYYKLINEYSDIIGANWIYW